MFKKQLVIVKTFIILLLIINKKIKSLNQFLQDIRESVIAISITLNFINSESILILSNTIAILDLITELNLILQLHVKQLNLKTSESLKFDLIILNERKT